MDDMLYVAMSGAEQIMLAQAVNANNLANLSTTGFKADLTNSEGQPVFGDIYASRVYAMTEQPGVDLSPGALMSTGRDLDIAVNGEGFFAVQGPDGTEKYSRQGELKLTEEGLLVTANNLPILGDGGPITIGAYKKLEIGIDGSVSMVPQGSSSDTLVFIDRIKLVNPEKSNVAKSDDGLFHLKDGTIAEPDASVSLSSGFLESSNVNAVEAITNMISLARQFEIELKMMKTADETAQADSSLLSLS